MQHAADSAKRPVIGVTGRRKPMRDVGGFPEPLHHLEGDLYFVDYAASVWEAGGMPVYLPSIVNFAEWVHYLDGVVFAGGADIEPERYGHDNTASETEPGRDINEFALYAAAREANLAMLGICRGFQVFNVAAGGTMHQHVPEHSRDDTDPATPQHKVTFVPGSTLYDLYGPSLMTNSLHHQTLDAIGDGFVVTATASDGTPEGIELPGAPVLAVQWHPEMMQRDLTPFRWLVSQATAHTERRAGAEMIVRANQ